MGFPAETHLRTECLAVATGLEHPTTASLHRGHPMDKAELHGAPAGRSLERCSPSAQQPRARGDPRGVTVQRDPPAAWTWLVNAGASRSTTRCAEARDARGRDPQPRPDSTERCSIARVAATERSRRSPPRVALAPVDDGHHALVRASTVRRDDPRNWGTHQGGAAGDRGHRGSDEGR